MTPVYRRLSLPLAAVLFTLATLVASAVSAADLVPYQADGWKYMQVNSGDPLESTFMQVNFDDSSWPIGKAGFGNGGCNMVVNTGWQENTTILIRRWFTASAAQPVTVRFGVDNDATVWVNGVAVGAVVHEGCPVLDNFLISIPAALITNGANLVAVRGVDRGSVSFLDVRVEGELPVPTIPSSWGTIKAIYR